MDFSDKLYFILSELGEHKRCKTDVMTDCVKQRLDKALKSYNDSLVDSVNYLSHRDNINLLRRLSRGD